MPIGTILVKRYVGALFAAAKDEGQVDNVFKSLENLEQAFRSVSELETYILSPEVPASQKITALQTSVGGEPPDILKRFFQLVLSKHRAEILPEVFQTYDRLREEALGHVRVKVTTAVTVTPQLQEEITGKLNELTSKTPVIAWQIDPSLLGGYRIVVENRCYDFSLNRQLVNLQERMVA